MVHLLAPEVLMPRMVIIAAALAAVLVSGSARAREGGQSGWVKTADFTSYSDLSRLSKGQCTLVVSDCETCSYQADGSATCTTPGFACSASRWVCMRFSAPAENASPPR